MRKSTIRLIPLGQLALGGGDLPATIIRLMMACNDLTLANDSLMAWHGERPAGQERRLPGAKMYFVRLQIAHIFEALSIIENIRDIEELRAAVDACDKRTQESFSKVASFIRSDDYEKMVRIRNNIRFHYDKGVVQKALSTSILNKSDECFKMSMGCDAIDWFFEHSDRIIDQIVVHDIFGVGQDADIRSEVDKIVDRLQAVGDKFVDFAGNFIWHHSARR